MIEHRGPCTFTLYDGGRPWRTHEAVAVYIDDAADWTDGFFKDPSLTLIVEDLEGGVFRYPGWGMFETRDADG